MQVEEGKSSFIFEEPHSILIDALANEHLSQSRLSTTRCFIKRLHLLESIQWIEHMAFFAQLAGASCTGTLVRALGSLGSIYHELGQPRLAARCFELTALLAVDTGDRVAAAAAYSGVGSARSAVARATLEAAPQSWAAFSRVQAQAIEVMHGVASA